MTQTLSDSSIPILFLAAVLVAGLVTADRFVTAHRGTPLTVQVRSETPDAEPARAAQVPGLLLRQHTPDWTARRLSPPYAGPSAPSPAARLSACDVTRLPVRPPRPLQVAAASPAALAF